MTMQNPFDGDSPRWPRIVGAVTGAYAVLGGSLTLVGWYTGPGRLLSWDDSGITMKANTALSVMLAGAALMSLSLRMRSQRLAMVLGAVVAAVGGLTVLEHITGANLGIDTLLVSEPAGALATSAPGRMGPPGSTSLLLIGTALFILARGRGPHALAALCGVITTAIALLSIIGYWYGAALMYSIPRVTGIAFQTATMLFALGIAIVVSVPDSEPTRLLRARTAAGRLARSTLPFILILPPILGWLRLTGERVGVFDAAFGTALFVLVNIVVLTLLWWLSLKSADRHETALASAQTELVAKGHQLIHVTDSAAVIVAQCSRDLRYLFVNRACAEFLGLPAEKIVGRKIVDVMGAPALAVIQPHIARALRGERVEFESEIPYATAGKRYVRVVYTPDVDATGAITGWISAVTDLTDRQRIEIALSTAAEALKEADRRKDEFLATLAHELRNPLAPIVNSLAILDGSRADASIVDAAITTMRRQLAQMVRMIDDLLDISRVTRDILELRLELVDLRRVIADAVDATRPVAERTRHKMIVSVPPEPVLLNADPARLTQVLGNLLHNACKFSDDGTSIRLDVSCDGEVVVIAVRDEGIGMGSEHLESVFDIFMQVDRSLSRSRSGLGIGLTLVRRFVAMHGGTVTAHSDGYGKGSTFTVRLPARVAAPREERPEEPRSAAAGSQRHRILVVDDHRDAATTLSALLRMNGNEVRLAHDGEAAVTEADSYRPDVILLDIGLPRKTGYDVCREIRGTEWGRRALIIAISGWGQDDDRRQSREAGFDRHMVKPVDVAQLCALLATTAVVPGEQQTV
jgi:PAS domain S-box-containing protein